MILEKEIEGAKVSYSINSAKEACDIASFIFRHTSVSKCVVIEEIKTSDASVKLKVINKLSDDFKGYLVVFAAGREGDKSSANLTRKMLESFMAETAMMYNMEWIYDDETARYFIVHNEASKSVIRELEAYGVAFRITEMLADGKDTEYLAKAIIAQDGSVDDIYKLIDSMRETGSKAIEAF